jgi:type I restriction enzyme S subunit
MDDGSYVECGGNDAALAGHALSRAPGAAPSTGRAEEGELPEGWRSTPFTETLCPEKPRVTKVQQSNYRKSGRFPIIDQGQTFIAGYWDSENDVYREHLPVIVFGDHTRVFKFIDFPFVAGADGTHVLVPDTRRFDPFFLYLALSSLDIPSRGYNRHFRLLKDRSVVTPPLPEQQAIASVLRTVQGAKAVCEHVLAATRQLKQSLLHHLFTYGPVPFAEADKVELQEIHGGFCPASWRCGRFDEFLVLQRGFDITKSEQRPGQVPVVSSGGVFSFHDTAMVKGPGVVVGRKGSLGTTHYIASGYWPHDTTLWVKDFMGNEPRFSFYLLGTLNLELLDTGTSNPTLNRNYVHALKVGFPNVVEQREIAARLSAVDAKVAAEESRRAALAVLFQSLLHQMMTARLRLPEFLNAKAPRREAAKETAT